EAYSLDGRFLWRHDMGRSIEAGTWYAPYVVYDLDGDGKAEVYCKGGEGDPREPEGHVKTGPEWLYKLAGQTGQIVKKIPWIPRLPEIGDYNYFCRNMLAIAYLDGRRPHLLMQRGTYKAIVLEAYDPDLKLVWRWNSHQEQEKYDSQGAHTIRVADVDGDGCDEIIVGSCLLDHDGKALWTLGIGHPDTCYVGKIDPKLPGLQIFFGIEPRQKKGAVRLVDALSGKTLWANEEPTVHVHNQGMCADILAEHPGQECYAGEAKGGDQAWLYTAQGKRIGHENLGSLAPWTLWWDADPQKEIILKGKLMKYQGETLCAPAGADRAQLVADLLGDWREELVTAYKGELRIYSTTIPAKTRRTCLMQDRLYRLYVATNSMGYNTPPQHSNP
ncbi:MAG: silent information regulator protein Sir2, partial [Planctomycetota bacterium]|nr:silent information regulator protein Sir2 [Planctomycetota bacterium]